MSSDVRDKKKTLWGHQGVAILAPRVFYCMSALSFILMPRRVLVSTVTSEGSSMPCLSLVSCI